MTQFGKSLAGRRVLVTGGLGLLGSSLVARASDAGAEVTALHRGNDPVAVDVSAHVNVARADVSNQEALANEFERARPELVIHLAGVSAVGDAQRLPKESVESSVVGTLNVLEEARRSEARGVVVASSDKAYGESDRLPYTEEMELRPKYPYEAAKAAADVITRSYWHTYGLPVAVMRSANLYGPGDRNVSRLVPSTISAILQDRRPTVRSDGSPERDYLFVDDAAAAYLAVIDLLFEGEGFGEAFNVGTGVPRRAIDLVRSVLASAGSRLEPEILGSGTPEGEIGRQYMDSSKLERLTGWSAQTSLEEGIAQTIDWYREHPAALGL